MNALSSSAGTQPQAWRRVSPRQPCSVCGKPDWCTFSSDGLVACCMRIESPRQLRNEGWLHRIGTPGLQTQPTDSGPLVSAPTNLAPIERRDRVYRVLVQELGLLPGHREHLQDVRGLPPAALEGFATAPGQDPDRRRQIATRIIDRLGSSDVLRGVPGFLVDFHSHWTCRATAPGFLIPVPDTAGRVQGFQLRPDDSRADCPRYIWYSSRGRPGGSSPGAPGAVWLPALSAQGPAWLTEGPLKAAIAAWHLRAHVIGVAGVANWRRAVELVPRKAEVVIAFDADAATNPLVAHHQLELARALFWAGNPVAIATWDPHFKGVDDAILAGTKITLQGWPSGSGAELLQDEGAMGRSLAEAGE